MKASHIVLNAIFLITNQCILLSQVHKVVLSQVHKVVQVISVTFQFRMNSLTGYFFARMGKLAKSANNRQWNLQSGTIVIWFT